MDEAAVFATQSATTLADLLDIQAIRDVVMRYSRGADRCDRELLASVFHDDATLEYGTFFRGSALAYIDQVLHALRTDSFATQHTVSNVLVELDGDQAYVEAYAVAYHHRTGTRRPEESGRLDLWGGRYVDRFERRSGEWRIANRNCVIDWTFASHPDGEFAWGPPWGRRDVEDPSYGILTTGR